MISNLLEPIDTSGQLSLLFAEIIIPIYAIEQE